MLCGGAHRLDVVHRNTIRPDAFSAFSPSTLRCGVSSWCWVGDDVGDLSGLFCS